MKRITLRRPIIVLAARYEDETYSTQVKGLLAEIVLRDKGTITVEAYKGFYGKPEERLGVHELGTFKEPFKNYSERDAFWSLDNRIPVRIELSASVIDSVVEEDAS